MNINYPLAKQIGSATDTSLAIVAFPHCRLAFHHRGLIGVEYERRWYVADRESDEYRQIGTSMLRALNFLDTTTKGVRRHQRIPNQQLQVMAETIASGEAHAMLTDLHTAATAASKEMEGLYG
jgi:hypothetical protein